MSEGYGPNQRVLDPAADHNIAKKIVVAEEGHDNVIDNMAVETSEGNLGNFTNPWPDIRQYAPNITAAE